MDVPLGAGSIPVSIPDCSVTVADPAGGATVDVRAAAERALADPLGPPLRGRVDPDDDVAIVVTRGLRDHDLYVTNSEAPAVVDDCLMHATADVSDALEAGSGILVAPDATNTLFVDR